MMFLELANHSQPCHKLHKENLRGLFLQQHLQERRPSLPHTAPLLLLTLLLPQTMQNLLILKLFLCPHQQELLQFPLSVRLQPSAAVCCIPSPEEGPQAAPMCPQLLLSLQFS